MKIEELRQTVTCGFARIACTVTWEDANRPQQEVFFEVEEHFRGELSLNANPFLLATIVTGHHFGERRVKVEGKVCPQLRNGLYTALLQLQHWYSEMGSPPKIEATGGFEPLAPPPAPRTASLLSGGVDSLATVITNRSDFPMSHPGAIQDCFFVYGFDIGGYPALEERRLHFQSLVLRLRRFTDSVDARLIPVYTNLRYLEGEEADPHDNRVFTPKSHGSALAAVAHAFSGKITQALIASSSCVSCLRPHGSHPLLDVNYSSSSLSVLHDGVRLSRLEKVGLVSQSTAALGTLRACLDPFLPDGLINCGRCEKCLRTMTQLLVHEKLQQCPTYPEEVTSQDLKKLKTFWEEGDSPFAILPPTVAYHWRQLGKLLPAKGRQDLAEVVAVKLVEIEKILVRLQGPLWRVRVKQLDDLLLDGVLRQAVRKIRRTKAGERHVGKPDRSGRSRILTGGSGSAQGSS